MATQECKPPLTRAESAIVDRALAILDRKLRQNSMESMGSPTMARKFLATRYALAQREVFSVLFLNVQLRLIACEELFHGTLQETSVYPREVVKAALRHNAAAVMLAHNHPSGVAEPSYADETITQTIRQALALVGISVIDHFIVGGTSTMSFAERGILGGPSPPPTAPKKKKAAGTKSNG